MKINLFIVGAQKAGTTSLLKYLSEHPEIESHFTIEFSAFINDKEYNEGIDKSISKYFEFKNPNPKILLAKCALMYNSEIGISRLKKYNSKAKIIFLIREPVRRAISSYHFEKMHGWAPSRTISEISEVIKKDDKEDGMYRMFLKLGMYSEAYKLLLKYFPKDQIKVILFEDFKRKTEQINKDVFSFAEVDENFAPNIEKVHNETKTVRFHFLAQVYLFLMTKGAVIKNVFKYLLPLRTFESVKNKLLEFNKKSGTTEEVDSKTQKVLYDFFQPYNRDLENLLDIDISNWDKLENR